MSLSLDAREVLKYLNQLGYCNITKEQLKEFIHDLKKLVKYDNEDYECENRPRPTDGEPSQNKQTPNSGSVLGNRPTEISDISQGPETLQDLIAPCNTTASSYKNINVTNSQSRTVDKENVRGHKQLQHDKIYSSSTRPTANSSKSESVSSSSGSSSLDVFNSYPKAKLTEHSHGSGKHMKVTTKTTTSFIRPWRLVSAPLKSVPDLRRTDPVSLYHHYQTIWKRQKMPGEDNHAELRWSIRERMLGQDPHPRPVSQASSIEHLKRHQARK